MINREKVVRHIIAEISIAKTCKKDFASVDIDMLSDALDLLKEQEATVKQWTKEIADYQLAHAPDSHDKDEKYQYKKGIWDGLQIAWNIISEGREVNEID